MIYLLAKFMDFAATLNSFVSFAINKKYRELHLDINKFKNINHEKLD